MTDTLISISHITVPVIMHWLAYFCKCAPLLHNTSMLAKWKFCITIHYPIDLKDNILTFYPTHTNKKGCLIKTRTQLFHSSTEWQIGYSCIMINTFMIYNWYINFLRKLFTNTSRIAFNGTYYYPESRYAFTFNKGVF